MSGEFHQTASGPWLGALLLGAALALLDQGAAQAQTDTLRLNALVQEADLLLEEHKALEPATQKITEDGEKLRAEQQALQTEVQAVNDGIKAFNASMDTFNDDAKTHRSTCSGQSTDVDFIASCNARLIELRERAQKLDTSRTELTARQDAVNKRVVAYNTTSAEYNKRKQDNDARGSVHERDLRDWLSRVREYFLSDDFKAVAGDPPPQPACDETRIGSLGTLPSAQALEQAYACLKAVQPLAR